MNSEVWRIWEELGEGKEYDQSRVHEQILW